MDLNERILVEEEDLEEAIRVLDANDIDNDLDEGDRIMVSETELDNAIERLEDAGIDCEIL